MDEPERSPYSRDAFERLVEEYADRVFNVALRITGDWNDAEDAMQEAFLSAYQGWSGFRGESNPKTWLYRITTNYCLNLIRDRTTHRRLLELNARDPSCVYGCSEPSTTIAVRRLLREADPRQAAVAVYVYVDGMRREEVAEVMGCSIRTVGNLLVKFGEWARRQFAEEAKPTAERRTTGLERLTENR